MSDLPARCAVYAKLGAHLAALNDAGLRALLGAGPLTQGWGIHESVTVDEVPTFVKRIPVTDLELDNRFSTRNHYDLPLYYCYGVGSAGFGAWRELFTHERTTNWVLDGAHEAFPLMYHYRIVSRDSVAPQDWSAYVTRWGSSEAVGQYMRDRTSATHELVIFLEHIPHEMATWLGQNQSAVEDVVRQLVDTIGFLRANGVVHFDAHFGNVVTDGSRVYLTDYGLVLDGAFHLSAEERTFLRQHEYYDYGLALMSLGHALAGPYMELTSERRTRLHELVGLAADAGPAAAIVGAIREIEQVAQADAFPLDPAFVHALVRYRRVMGHMFQFIETLSANPRKDTLYDDAALRSLLKQARVV